MRQALWAACALVVGALLASALLRAPAPEAAGAAEVEGDLSALSLEEVRGRAPVASGARAPEWRVGDAWRVQFDDGQPICWLVVVEATAEGYEQGVWCPTDEAELIAAQLAAFELAYVGRFTASLEGRAAEDAFRFYDWPLEDGKTWSTTWEGQEVKVVAEAARGDRWIFTATYVESEETLAVYDYDPELAWWSVIEFPPSGYVFRVHERATGWEGDVLHARGEDRYEARREESTLGQPAAVFNIEEQDAMVALVIDWFGAPFGRFEVRDAAGDTVYERTMIGDDDDTYELMPGSPGIWSIVDGVTGLVDAHIRVRGIAVDVVTL